MRTLTWHDDNFVDVANEPQVSYIVFRVQIPRRFHQPPDQLLGEGNDLFGGGQISASVDYMGRNLPSTVNHLQFLFPLDRPPVFVFFKEVFVVVRLGRVLFIFVNVKDDERRDAFDIGDALEDVGQFRRLAGLFPCKKEILIERKATLNTAERT